MDNACREIVTVSTANQGNEREPLRAIAAAMQLTFRSSGTWRTAQSSVEQLTAFVLAAAGFVLEGPAACEGRKSVLNP